MCDLPSISIVPTGSGLPPERRASGVAALSGLRASATSGESGVALLLPFEVTIGEMSLVVQDGPEDLWNWRVAGSARLLGGSGTTSS